MLTQQSGASMDMSDRDILIRVEQQMQDTSRNQTQIMSDLKEIFNRIESDSKVVSQLKGDDKAFYETTNLKMTEFERRQAEVQVQAKDLAAELKSEKEQRAKVEKDFNAFQSESRGSITAIKWIFSIVAAVATIINVVIALSKVHP